jgi:hypothetical protein
MEAGAVAALVVAGLAKAIGRGIDASADLGFLGELLMAGAEVAGKVTPVEQWVNRWLRPKRRERMLRSASWYDLAGLAWGEHLYEAADEALVVAFGVDAEQVRQRLDAEWFATLLQGPRGREVPVPRTEPAYGDELDPAFVRELGRVLAAEAAERLMLDEDPAVAHLEAAIDGLPARIARLVKQVPGYDGRMARLLLADRVVPGIERLLAYADGSVAAEEALRGMDRVSAETLALADRDTFGRDHFEDLPKLVHREVYVEPDVVGGRRRPRSARRGSARGS